MKISIFPNPHELGKAAGTAAEELINKAIESNGTANIILATGISQFETLHQIIMGKNIDWSKVVMFHLDEYIDLPVTHKASFRKYLQERFLSKLPPLKATYLINGEIDANIECVRLSNLISRHPIDVALVGIGENGHLAFNDPPADFVAEDPYIVVELDKACRKQQLEEGWFESIEEVPRKAISMSIKQILKSKHIVCSVPESRKAIAVKNMLKQPISNIRPSSILQTHMNCTCYLDTDSAKLISENLVS